MKKAVSVLSLFVAAVSSHAYFNLTSTTPNPFIFQYFEPSMNYADQAGFGNVGFSSGSQINYYQDIMYQQAYWYRTSVNGVSDYREYQVAFYTGQKQTGANSIEQYALGNVFGAPNGLEFTFTYTINSISSNQATVNITATIQNVTNKTVDVSFYPYEDLQTTPDTYGTDRVSYDPATTSFKYTNTTANTNVAYYRAFAQPDYYEGAKYLNLRGSLSNSIRDQYLANYVPPISADFATAFQYDFTLAPNASKTLEFGVGLNAMPEKLNALAGTISLQGLTDLAGEKLDCQLRNPDTGEVIESNSVTVGEFGDFQLITGKTGTFDIAIKGSTFLRKIVRSVEIEAGFNTGLSANLLNGDCDGDNYVSTDDYLIVSDNFDTTSDDLFWDKRADLDRNGAVNTDDYLLISENFDLPGED